MLKKYFLALSPNVNTLDKSTGTTLLIVKRYCVSVITARFYKCAGVKD
jgi:hypothetical protein